MLWVIGIIKFIFSAIGIFTSGCFLLSCISAIQNPQLVVHEGKVTEQNDNARIVFLFILAISWAIVIALP